MLETVRTEQMENLVEELVVDNTEDNTEDVIRIAKVLANSKYKKGDKVFYLDIGGDENVATISEVTYTEIYPWNDEIKPLYMMNTYPYLRTEEEILDLYNIVYK